MFACLSRCIPTIRALQELQASKKSNVSIHVFEDAISFF